MGPTLYVGTDISEAVNRTRFLDPGETEVGRGFTSANDLPGSEELAEEALRRARGMGATEIRWGLEATNLFWWHLATYLTTHPELLTGGLKVWVFNPRQVASFKDAYGDLGKGDWVDALVIADRLRFGRLPAECYLDERYQPLQRLTRHRRHLVKTLVREKQVALGYVYLKLSAYNLTRPLADTFGATSQVLLSDYLTPDEIVAASLEELAELIARESRGKVADPGAVAGAVKQAARRSYRLPARMVEPVNLVLSSSLATIRTLSAQLKPIDKAIATELEAVPPQTVDTVPGLGPVFTAGIVAEVGDVRRFESEGQTAKFAGLTWRRHQQDPASSRAWQLRRALELIKPAGGEVVEEFFDVGQSRSLPWKRRPEASRLLELLRSPDRGFEAVAIGEPQRAFYGAQFALTFPLFEHYGVDLWVPEVGGRIDPGSEAHDMVMTLFGGMSKGERSRIRTRVRNAMAAQAATQGRFLGGRPPFGYRLGDAGPHPTPGKAALGIRIHRLEPDPVTAPVVVRIFEEYVSGRGLFAIAESLTRDGIPSPSAYDRARNSHRNGQGWSKSAVRAILINPRYTGVAVWGRQRRDEVLVDVEDVAAGHRTRLRWNDEDAWVRSPGVAHEPLISQEVFEAARVRRAANGRTTIRKPRRTPRPYLLRGLLRCGLCDRRMQGSWNHEEAYYRCRYPAEYALPRPAKHPPTVYVREDQVVPPLDDWIAGIFEPDRLEETCRALAEAHEPALEDDGRAEAARRTLADCDARLARYREALEAGTDPTVVARWISEVQAERSAAEEELRRRRPAAALTEVDIRAMVESLGDLLGVLEAAQPAKKAALYKSLGLTLTYEPSKRRVLVEADLGGVRPVRVGGGI